MNIRSIIIALIIGIAFIVGLSISAGKLVKLRRSANEITVTGNAEKTLVSDIIVWETSYEANSKDMQAAYKELTRNKEAVRRYISSQGVPDSSVTFQSVDIGRIYDNSYNGVSHTEVFVGYRLTQKIRISSFDVDRIEKVSRGISELIDQGIVISSQTPLYYYSKLDESKHELLESASADARARAGAIAKGSKLKVGKLLRSQMGVFQIVGQYSNEQYGWGGTFNTSSKIKTITVTVKNSYAVR